MQLIDTLQHIAETHESYFQQFLAKEDIARLEKLALLAKVSEDEAAFIKEGLYIGWTQDDMRSHELKETLTPVLKALYAIWNDGADEKQVGLSEAWASFVQDRLEKLIHCL
ncbi:MAG: hypothetical protein ACWA5L_06170 [bacterium]